MKAAQGKALTPTSFVCDKKRRRYQSLLSVLLTVIAFNSPLILLSVLMSGTGKSQMLRLDQMHPVATLISWQRGSSFDDKLWVLQIMSSWTLGVCVGKLLTCLESVGSGIPVPAKGQPHWLLQCLSCWEGARELYSHGQPHNTKPKRPQGDLNMTLNSPNAVKGVSK